ncbi:uncharacterized protein LOC135224864 [Macrobrachium nipponense]|uniref:uncharacterized protein LOC135224864 n=1 Tax=Macrobrachium nipponense TaxID=159736 RepID=UPI0030C84DBD
MNILPERFMKDDKRDYCLEYIVELCYPSPPFDKKVSQKYFPSTNLLKVSQGEVEKLADLREKKDVVYVQETRWKGKKELGDGYKLYYSGANKQGFEDVQECWARNPAVIRRHGKELLGETSGIIWEEKGSWWLDEDIEKVIKDKKEAKKRWEESQSAEDRDRFREINKMVKKVVAQAKAKSYDVYNELGTKKGLTKMIKLSKARNKSTKDIAHIKQIKDQDGVVLRKEEDIVNRWKEYF